MSEPRPQRSKKPTKFFDDIDDDARSPEGGCPPSPNLDCQPLPPTTTTLKAKGGRPRKSTAPRIKPTSEDESQSPPDAQSQAPPMKRSKSNKQQPPQPQPLPRLSSPPAPRIFGLPDHLLALSQTLPPIPLAFASSPVPSQSPFTFPPTSSSFSFSASASLSNPSDYGDSFPPLPSHPQDFEKAITETPFFEEKKSKVSLPPLPALPTVPTVPPSSPLSEISTSPTCEASTSASANTAKRPLPPTSKQEEEVEPPKKRQYNKKPKPVNPSSDTGAGVVGGKKGKKLPSTSSAPSSSGGLLKEETETGSRSGAEGKVGKKLQKGSKEQEAGPSAKPKPKHSGVPTKEKQQQQQAKPSGLKKEDVASGGSSTQAFLADLLGGTSVPKPKPKDPKSVLPSLKPIPKLAQRPRPPQQPTVESDQPAWAMEFLGVGSSSKDKPKVEKEKEKEKNEPPTASTSNRNSALSHDEYLKEIAVRRAAEKKAIADGAKKAFDLLSPLDGMAAFEAELRADVNRIQKEDNEKYGHLRPPPVPLPRLTTYGSVYSLWPRKRDA